MWYKALLFWIIFFWFSYSDENDQKRISQQHLDAVNRALEYLASQQDPKKGHWAGGQKIRDKEKYAIATTSFATMAFLANGNMPGRGKYGEHVSKGLSFILSNVGDLGYIASSGDDSKMHGHGYATLLLAQIYGMAPENIIIRDKTFEGQRVIQNEDLKKKLERAIKLIHDSQTIDGGWGYEPSSTAHDHEGSITVCQLQALRAAHNAGIVVNTKVIADALSYLRRSAKKNGSFKYRLNDSTSRDSYGLTAAAISTFHAIGEYQSKEVMNGFDFLELGKYDEVKDAVSDDEYYSAFWCYAQYYAAQAYFHHPDESIWEKFYYKPKGIRAYLLRKQLSNGSWKHPGSSYRFNNSYSTAVCVLILEIPLGYLPIFQR